MSTFTPETTPATTANPFATAPGSNAGSLVLEPEQPATAASGDPQEAPAAEGGEKAKRKYTTSTPAERAQRRVDTLAGKIEKKKATLAKQEAAVAGVDALKADIASLEEQHVYAQQDPALRTDDGQVPGQTSIDDA